MSRRKETETMRKIATIRTEFPQKFGIPRQSGLVPELRGKVVFEPEYRQPEALRGLEGFSHIWLLWEFSQARRDTWSATVRPPRLGGNERIGVFATRSPFRPNPIGLSSVRLEQIEWDTPEGPVLIVAGADLMDQTPIYDIKPYLVYADCHPDAVDGFVREQERHELDVHMTPQQCEQVPPQKFEALRQVLAQDPRPSYQQDPQRIYGMSFGGLDVRFRVEEDDLYVTEIKENDDEDIQKSIDIQL